MNYDYLYEFNKYRYKNLNERKLEFKSKLDIIEIEDGYLLPARASNGYLIGKGGVLNSNFEFVKESCITSGSKFISAPLDNENEVYFGGKYDFDIKETVSYDEEIVYMGYINNHWGHFLVDFSTRLWYAIKYGVNKKYVFLVNENKDHNMIGNIKRFFELLGIPLDNIEIVNRISKYKRIIVPQASYVTNNYYSKEYLEIFERVASNVNFEEITTYEKVYFTRSGYSKAKSSEIGEEIFIDIFKENGFKIISPEKISLDKQIALIRGSKSIGGIIGTISHNMLFASQKQNIIILNKTYSLNVVQMDINLMKELDTKYIDAYVAPFPASLGHGPFILVYNENIKKFIKDFKWNNLKKVKNIDSIQRKNLIVYEKKYRKAINKFNKIEFEGNLSLNSYYCLENLKYYYEKYYLLARPISNIEKISGRINKVKFIMNKSMERLIDLLEQTLKSFNKVK